jgi:hypothetical protein
MELLDKYLSNQILDFALWISDPNHDIYQVRCERLHSLKPHRIYNGIMRGEILMETWVWDDINHDAPGWRQRVRKLLVTNGYGNLRSFEILHDEVEFHDKTDTLTFSFNCREEFYE